MLAEKTYSLRSTIEAAQGQGKQDLVFKILSTLSTIQHPAWEDCITGLIDSARQDSSGSALVDALGRTHEPRVLRILVQRAGYYGTPDWKREVALEAVRANAADHLADCYAQAVTWPSLFSWAAKGLSSLRHSGSIPHLLRHLSDEYSFLVSEALDALDNQDVPPDVYRRLDFISDSGDSTALDALGRGLITSDGTAVLVNFHESLRTSFEAGCALGLIAEHQCPQCGIHQRVTTFPNLFGGEGWFNDLTCVQPFSFKYRSTSAESFLIGLSWPNGKAPLLRVLRAWLFKPDDSGLEDKDHKYVLVTLVSRSYSSKRNKLRLPLDKPASWWIRKAYDALGVIPGVNSTPAISDERGDVLITGSHSDKRTLHEKGVRTGDILYL
jgi:hypothetical protein